MIKIENVQKRIISIRDVQVLLDIDLAELYQVETRALNQAVKRNSERFPEDFMFQLTNDEWDNLKSQNVISKTHGGRRKLPFAFTEQGVAGLSGVLKSEVASKVHVEIMRAFVEMRKIYASYATLFQRIEKVEKKQIDTDLKFEQIFTAIESKQLPPKQGVFYDGQVFDAFKLVSNIIKSAQRNIIIIDNYIDVDVLTYLMEKGKGVSCIILTKHITNHLKMAVEKFNSQFGNLQIKEFNNSHDRFVIIDNEVIYHIGASLKDLGKKWFAFSKLDASSLQIMEKIKIFV